MDTDNEDRTRRFATEPRLGVPERNKTSGGEMAARRVRITPDHLDLQPVSRSGAILSHREAVLREARARRSTSKDIRKRTHEHEDTKRASHHPEMYAEERPSIRRRRFTQGEVNARRVHALKNVPGRSTETFIPSPAKSSMRRASSPYTPPEDSISEPPTFKTFSIRLQSAVERERTAWIGTMLTTTREAHREMEVRHDRPKKTR